MKINVSVRLIDNKIIRTVFANSYIIRTNIFSINCTQRPATLLLVKVVLELLNGSIFLKAEQKGVIL